MTKSFGFEYISHKHFILYCTITSVLKKKKYEKMTCKNISLTNKNK